MLFLVLCIYSLFPFNTTHCGLNNTPQRVSYLKNVYSEDHQQKKRYKINHIQTPLIQNPLLKVRLLSREESQFNSCVTAILTNNIELLRKNLDNLNVNTAYTVFIPYAHHSLRQLYENKQYSLLEFAIMRHKEFCPHDSLTPMRQPCFLNIILQRNAECFRPGPTTNMGALFLASSYDDQNAFVVIMQHVDHLSKKSMNRIRP